MYSSIMCFRSNSELLDSLVCSELTIFTLSNAVQSFRAMEETQEGFLDGE
jgi:hypothetical protein